MEKTLRDEAMLAVLNGLMFNNDTNLGALEDSDVELKRFAAFVLKITDAIMEQREV